MAPRNPGSAAFSVMLNYGPLGLVRAAAHGMDENSMLVDTGAIKLPRHAVVEVTLFHRDGRRLCAERLQAKVAEHATGRTRLTFQGCPQERSGILGKLANTHPQVA